MKNKLTQEISNLLQDQLNLSLHDSWFYSRIIVGLVEDTLDIEITEDDT